jgi:hypothetical protein
MRRKIATAAAAAQAFRSPERRFRGIGTMTDLLNAIATAGQALNYLESLRSAKDAGHTEWKLQFAIAINLVAEIRNTLAEVQGTLKLRDQEIESLRARFTKFRDTVEVSGYLYDKGDGGRPRGYAYCPVCTQKFGLMLHLTATRERGRLEQQCPNCKSFYDEIKVF